MNRPTIEAVAFDLDGTLVDTAGGIAMALNCALAEIGQAPFNLDRVRAWIGAGPDTLIERALGASGIVDAPALRARLRRRFDEATLDAPMAGCVVYHGIDEALATLARHRAIVVVTNKPTALARAVVGAAGLLHHVRAVHGADEPAMRKPSPNLVLQAARSLGVAPARLLMVGDADVDIAAARAAGSVAAWAAWGYGRPSRDGADDVPAIAAPSALPAFVDGDAPAHDIDRRRPPCPLAASPP